MVRLVRFGDRMVQIWVNHAAGTLLCAANGLGTLVIWWCMVGFWAGYGCFTVDTLAAPKNLQPYLPCEQFQTVHVVLIVISIVSNSYQYLQSIMLYFAHCVDSLPCNICCL